MQINKKFSLVYILPSTFGHSPQGGEKFYFTIGFFAPSGGDAA